ncbi:hypothetical protein CPB83DRAFT_842451 [Crepidotus variabilis]|uniref:ER membrane protein complex subunit 7 beta-sandwich domain-containing protein n=1 Tax=Crepidotus variabilis TaxID=179855 RepID=A0A9P6JX08_9AGAR|nr:hypothetical protein CPB83DRAFT_842451 [Crepidotus variabilis]
MARLITLFLQALLAFFPLARAIDVTGHVAWNVVCLNTTALGPATVSLDEGVHYGSITRGGRFTIPDVPDGSYLLSVHSHHYVFDQLRIDVANASATPVEVHPYIPGTPFNPSSAVVLPYPIVLAPKERYSFFMPRESFNIGGMLSNPMMLMMIGLGVFMLLTPYIMKNLDPETLEELKKEQAKMHTALQSGDLKGLSSIMTGNGEGSQESKPAVQTPSKGKAGKKGKR